MDSNAGSVIMRAAMRLVKTRTWAWATLGMAVVVTGLSSGCGGESTTPPPTPPKVQPKGDSSPAQETPKRPESEIKLPEPD